MEPLGNTIGERSDDLPGAFHSNNHPQISDSVRTNLWHPVTTLYGQLCVPGPRGNR